jgi:hypothetical protein
LFANRKTSTTAPAALQAVRDCPAIESELTPCFVRATASTAKSVPILKTPRLFARRAGPLARPLARDRRAAFRSSVEARSPC